MKTQLLIASIFFSGFAFAQEKKTDTIKTKNIEAVTLTKKVFKKQSDRFVYDVAASPIAKGNTTFDLLKQTPLISTTDEKTLKIAGKNSAIIFINNKRSNMDTESLAQFLKNTPAENIQKIEVITLPGSEYQVDGSEGIINIILKKKSTDGINGNFRMSNSQYLYNSTSSSLALNYRKDKLGINANLSTSNNLSGQEYLLRNGTETIKNKTEGRVNDPNINLGGYLNFDYEFNDKNSIAFSWNNWNHKSENSKSDLLNTVESYMNGSWEKFYSRTINDDSSKSRNNNFNLNYELKTDSLGSRLNVNAAYLYYKKNQYSENQTLASDNFGSYGNLLQNTIQNTPQIINNFSGKIDYIQKFKNNFTTSFGGNYNNTRTNNDTKSETLFLDPFKPTIYNPNHFIYDEHIYGLYLTVEKTFSDKFSAKIGARYEITKSTGKSDNAPIDRPDLAKVEQNYNNFLPYLSVNYGINDNNNISYAFSSRMRRPSFWELNPIKHFLTANNYIQNNPFVKASSSYNQELTYTFKNSYFLILNHSYFKDVINQVPLQRTIIENGVPNRQLAYIRTNFGDKQEMSALIGMQKSFFKQYLTTNFNIGVQHNINNGSLSIDPISGIAFDEYDNRRNSTSFIIQTNNNIRLDKAKTWFAGVNFFYVGKQQIELGTLDDLASLDLSIKKLWNNWTFSVNATDVLKTYLVEINDKQADGNYNYVRNNEFRRGITASVVYNFGNNKVKKIRKIETAVDDIKGRTQ